VWPSAIHVSEWFQGGLSRLVIMSDASRFGSAMSVIRIGGATGALSGHGS